MPYPVNIEIVRHARAITLDEAIASRCPCTVNIEAGAILANYRNEWKVKEIICFDGAHYWRTGQDKFGSLIGDGTRIGANAVLAPGTIINKAGLIKRLALIDQIPFEMQEKFGGSSSA